jgi:hypothetical protein
MDENNDIKTYANKVNPKGLANAKSLLSSGKIDWNSRWDFDASDGNEMLGTDGDNWEEYSKYHLGYHPEIDDKETKAYYSFPFGKNGKLYASAIRAIRSRAAQADADDIFKEAGIIMDKLNEKEENMALDKEKTDEYATEDKYPTAEEAEKRAKAMGGKGHHTIEVDGETLYMPFPNHDAYLAAKKKLDAEKSMSRMETLTDGTCDCDERKDSCDCKEEVKENSVKQTFNIEGIEIFSTGVWNGDKYTMNDLEAMVSNFGKTGFQPPIKLGHNEEQPEMGDGEPSLGYVDKIYKTGSKLLADFKELPLKVYEAIKRGNYKRVSSEIYWNYKSNDQVLDRVLKAVALLGSEIPAVTNLEAIEGLYSQDIGDGTIKKHYQEKESELMMESTDGQGITFKEYQELQDKVKSLEEENTKAITELEESKKEQRASEITKFIKEHKESGQILPVFENELEILMHSATDEKVHSYTVEEKTIELSQLELVQKIVQSFPKLVEFNEISQDGDAVVDRQPYDHAGDEVDRRANLFIKKGKAKDYSEALTLVFNDDEKLKEEYLEEIK